VKAPVKVTHVAQLASQPDLADRHDIVAEGLTGKRRRDRQRQRQIGPRVGDPCAADGEGVHVAAAGGKAATALEHRKQHR